MIVGLEDAEIVQGLRDGDRGAWNALCNQYSQRLWRYVARLVGRDEEAVAEIYQETMLAVAKSGRGLAEDSKLWPWLARIGHNQTALYWRKYYRNRGKRLEGHLVESKSEERPDAMLARAESVDCVRRLLTEMPSDHVTVLTAKYLDGLTVPEIVEVMGVTHESVRSKLARARRDFRKRYEKLVADETRPLFSTHTLPPESHSP